MMPLRWTYPEAYRQWRIMAEAQGLKLSDWQATVRNEDGPSVRLVLAAGDRRWEKDMASTDLSEPTGAVLDFFGQVAPEMAKALEKRYQAEMDNRTV
ncbi:MAG: hypothetical protein OWQ57_02770 [Sulfobacillus sp.]|nr:hypothetical protein [Sulfobacillus sp.]